MTILPHPALPPGAAATVSRRLTQFRTDLCVIERPNTGVSASGAPLGGYTAIAAVPCRVQASGRLPIESVYAERFGPVADYQISLAPGLEIRSDYRIAVNGKTMVVVADDDAKSNGFELKVLAKATSK